MRIAAVLVFLTAANIAFAGEMVVDVPIRLGIDGVRQAESYCIFKMRQAGFTEDDDIPAKQLGSCMRPEIEAMGEFAQYVQLFFGDPLLLKPEWLEICVGEWRIASSGSGGQDERDQATWRRLADCVTDARFTDKAELGDRLQKVRAAADFEKSMNEGLKKNESRRPAK